MSRNSSFYISIHFSIKYLHISESCTIFALANEKIAAINGAVVQLVRIHACHAWGRGFESRPHRKKEDCQQGSPLFLLSSTLYLFKIKPQPTKSTFRTKFSTDNSYSRITSIIYKLDFSESFITIRKQIRIFYYINLLNYKI